MRYVNVESLCFIPEMTIILYNKYTLIKEEAEGEYLSFDQMVTKQYLECVYLLTQKLYF